MSDQNLKRKQVTLSSFVKKIRKDEQQNTQEVKEDSRSTANGLPQHEKVFDDDIQEKMELIENLSIIADETTDIAEIRQFSLAVRFINANLIHEEFLQFIPVTNCTGIDLVSTILKSLESFGINLSFLRGQGYDGARSMSGELQGVNAHLKKNILLLYMYNAVHTV
ncbi:TTF-type domain-containing protein [Trichonephila inaurata madagascariensis]|uniref:TTF-type domain-containing protein n=1 Tax=Trichonephila inaurata madagascariensis TaxID=2747483 RepID=A0A8X6ITG2_9ARAC|nr:TTF-type domain-containing protein [Trichonephila inaurata madagascariensis]